MGTFTVACVIRNHVQRENSVHIPHVMVDTGSEATWIPRKKLSEARIKAEKRQPFQMPNGQVIYRDVGYAFIYVGDRETVDEVVFAEPGDYSLLGARTLEGLRLWVDPRGKKLLKLVTQPVAKVIVPGKVPPDKDQPPPVTTVVAYGKGGPPPVVPNASGTSKSRGRRPRRKRTQRNL